MTKVYFTRHKTTIIQHFLHNYNSFLSKPSVNRAVRTLTEEGYLQHAHYGSIELTDLGYVTARELYRRHRALRQFLILCLGVDKDVAEQEAFGLKHYISDDTCRRLRDFVEEF